VLADTLAGPSPVGGWPRATLGSDSSMPWLTHRKPLVPMANFSPHQWQSYLADGECAWHQEPTSGAHGSVVTSADAAILLATKPYIRNQRVGGSIPSRRTSEGPDRVRRPPRFAGSVLHRTFVSHLVEDAGVRVVDLRPSPCSPTPGLHRHPVTGQTAPGQRCGWMTALTESWTRPARVNASADSASEKWCVTRGLTSIRPEETRLIASGQVWL